MSFCGSVSAHTKDMGGKGNALQGPKMAELELAKNLNLGNRIIQCISNKCVHLI